MMFCPKCKAEYQDGYLVCDDCKVDLVENLSGESAPQVNCTEFVCVSELLTLDIGSIPMIKSVLDEENIVYFIQGENALYVQPGITVRLMVRKDQAESAREILNDLL